MGINLTSNFTEQAALPLDDRFIFADVTARNALAAGRRYKGLICWVIADELHYKLKNDLVTWEALSGSGASIPDFIGDAGAGGTAGLVPAPSAGDAAAGKFLFAGGTWSQISHSLLTDIGTKSHAAIDALLVNFTGDSGAGGVTGLVPAPGAGTAAAGKYLKADGTWANPPAVGSGVGGSILDTQYMHLLGGSSGTFHRAIHNFTSTAASSGSGVLTYTRSSSNGDSFTALVRCLVIATFSGFVDSFRQLGFSLNSSNLSTAVVSTSGRLAYEGGDTLSTAYASCSVSLILEAGDILRPHVNTDYSPTSPRLTITAIDIESEIGIIYSPFIGDTGTGGVEGLVPAPASGDATKVLSGDGTWKALPSSLPMRYGAGAPTLLTEIPTEATELYYDTTSTTDGFVTVWLYSDILTNWYPIRTKFLAKHLAEAIVFIEALVRTRLRPLLDTIQFNENMYKTRLRPISEGIIITENLIVLVLTSSSPEINGSAINGAPL